MRILLLLLLLAGCTPPHTPERQNIQAVKCADGEIFYIHIPNLVWDVEKYGEGFCDSL
jgi:hypothetical protein